MVMRFTGSFISISGMMSRPPLERKLGSRYTPSTRESHLSTTTLDLSEKGGNVLVIEGQTTAQQRVENHAAGPDIDFRPRVHASGNDLGCSVVRRTAGRIEKVAIHEPVGKTEIGNLDVVVLVEEKVLWLQITVHDVVVVAVLDPTDDLLKKASCLDLR